MVTSAIKTITSFSGADLIVSFGPKVIGELQSISYGIQREKAPVYTLGSPDPRSFSRGKRGIAGQLAFAVFDRDALMETLTEQTVWNSIAPPAMFTAKGNLAIQGSEDFSNLLNLAGWDATSSGGNDIAIASANVTAAKALVDILQAKIDFITNSGNTVPLELTNSLADAKIEVTTANTNLSTVTAQAAGATSMPQSGRSAVSVNRLVGNNGVSVAVPPGFGLIKRANILYADMLPPFDVTLTFANEYGQAAFQRIYDLDILNDGSGVSVDSIVMERHMTFIARRLSPLTSGVFTRSGDGIASGTPVY